MTTTTKPAQRTSRLWAKMALLPVLLVSLLAACGYSGTLSARDLLLESDSAIDNTGGEIRARRILYLKSGGDIINDSTTSSASGSSANSAYRKETIDRRGRIILDGEGGEEDNSKGGMHLYAGENIESRTGDIENRNSGSQSILSGKNVHFDVRTLDNRFTQNSGGESRLGAPGREYLSTRIATDHGSRIQGKGDIFIHAREGKVHGRGMQINSDDGIVGIYGRDGVDLHNGWEERDLISSQYHKGRRIIGRKENETYREEHSKSAIPGLISGKRVAIVIKGPAPTLVGAIDGNIHIQAGGHYDGTGALVHAGREGGPLTKEQWLQMSETERNQPRRQHLLQRRKWLSARSTQHTRPRNAQPLQTDRLHRQLGWHRGQRRPDRLANHENSERRRQHPWPDHERALSEKNPPQYGGFASPTSMCLSEQTKVKESRRKCENGVYMGVNRKIVRVVT